jgi:hypothetical protein
MRFYDATELKDRLLEMLDQHIAGLCKQNLGADYRDEWQLEDCTAPR